MTKLSVIIPTWCEAEGIASAVERARAIGDEVIVADAESPDGTAEIARASGARVISAAKGRGTQLRAGAAAATGDVFLFLHADAELGAEARAAILRALEHASVLGGNFALRFTGHGFASRLFTLGNHLRRRAFSVYYGDSALFVRREVYESLGGFRPYPLFEDYEFIRRLERQRPGRTIYVRDVAVTVSARRFERSPVRTLLSWALLQGMYSFGDVHPDRLVSLYADIRSAQQAVGVAGVVRSRSRMRQPPV